MVLDMRAQVFIPVIASILILGTLGLTQNIFAHPNPENICRNSGSDPSINFWRVVCTKTPELGQSVLFIEQGIAKHRTVIELHTETNHVGFNCGHLANEDEDGFCLLVLFNYVVVGK